MPILRQILKKFLRRNEFDILKGISQQAAISLQNIQMLEEKKEENRLSLRLLDLGNILSQADTLEDATNAAGMRILSECDMHGLALLSYQQDDAAYLLFDLLTRDSENSIIRGKNRHEVIRKTRSKVYLPPDSTWGCVFTPINFSTS